MKLSQFQEDAVAEAVNIGIGRAASCLSEMVSATVSLKVPSVRICSCADASKQAGITGGGLVTSITQGFDGTIAGNAAILLAEKDAITLAQLLNGDVPTSTSLDILQQGILEEVGNIILNGVLGSLANLLKAELSYDVPTFQLNEEGLSGLDVFGADAANPRDVLIANTHFDVSERSIQGSLLLVFDVGSVEALIKGLETLVA